MRIIKKLRDLLRMPNDLNNLQLELEQQKVLMGKFISEFNRNRKITNIHEVEFKVFSQ